MKLLLQRIFVNPFRPRASHEADQETVPCRPTLAQIRQAFHESVSDRLDIRAQRINYKIEQAATAAELWALRSDLHQYIAQVHSERVAAARINDLAALFEGWLPASQLTRIQPGFRTSEK